MSTNPSAASLILSNLKLFNDAATLLGNDMVTHLSEALNAHLDTFEKTSQWLVHSENEDIDFWISPKNWDRTPAKARKPRPLAFFTITSIEPGNEYYFWLTILCGVSRDGKAGIKLEISGQYIDTVQWKKEQTNLPADIVSALKDTGFEYIEDEGFFTPITLDPIALANAWDRGPVAMSKATTPFAEILDKLPRMASIIEPYLLKCAI